MTSCEDIPEGQAKPSLVKSGKCLLGDLIARCVLPLEGGSNIHVNSGDHVNSGRRSSGLQNSPMWVMLVQCECCATEGTVQELPGLMPCLIVVSSLADGFPQPAHATRLMAAVDNPSSFVALL